MRRLEPNSSSARRRPVVSFTTAAWSDSSQFKPETAIGRILGLQCGNQIGGEGCGTRFDHSLGYDKSAAHTGGCKTRSVNRLSSK
jgi:hypothetical protein